MERLKLERKVTFDMKEEVEVSYDPQTLTIPSRRVDMSERQMVRKQESGGGEVLIPWFRAKLI